MCLLYAIRTYLSLRNMLDENPPEASFPSGNTALYAKYFGSQANFFPFSTPQKDILASLLWTATYLYDVEPNYVRVQGSQVAYTNSSTYELLLIVSFIGCLYHSERLAQPPRSPRDSGSPLEPLGQELCTRIQGSEDSPTLLRSPQLGQLPPPGLGQRVWPSLDSSASRWEDVSGDSASRAGFSQVQPGHTHPPRDRPASQHGQGAAVGCDDGRNHFTNS